MSMGYDLLDIMKVNQEFAQEERAEQANPSQCPVCTGELVSGPDGSLGCRFDGWRQRGGTC